MRVLSGEPTLEQFVSWKARPQRPSEDTRGKATSRSQTVQKLVQALCCYWVSWSSVLGDWQVRRRSLLEALYHGSFNVLRSCSTLFESRPL